MKKNTTNLLIVDDEEDILRALRRFLESKGYGVMIAKDASAAYMIAHESAPDLVVLPTHREGFTRSLDEASAMGIPIETTQNPGCREAAGVLVGDIAIAPVVHEEYAGAQLPYHRQG